MEAWLITADESSLHLRGLRVGPWRGFQGEHVWGKEQGWRGPKADEQTQLGKEAEALGEREKRCALVLCLCSGSGVHGIHAGAPSPQLSVPAFRASGSELS